MYKEFIPYEQALKLKELGFYEGCIAHYEKINGKIKLEVYSYDLDDAICAAPLYQQAFRWFREKYELNHIIIFQSKTKTYDAGIIGDIKNFVDYSLIFNTYEEAELACLKKLIEIAKNNLNL